MAVPMRTIVNANGRKGRVAETYPPLVAGDLKLAPSDRIPDKAFEDDPDVVAAFDEPIPAKNAGADVWRTYAVSQGLTDDEAEAMSRDDLVAMFTTKE